jgi:hypothetical protein
MRQPSKCYTKNHEKGHAGRQAFLALGQSALTVVLFRLDTSWRFNVP